MSWKAVEMQIALPRTHDAGRVQEQMQQRSQFMQDILAQAHLQSEEIKKRTVSDLNEGENLRNRLRDRPRPTSNEALKTTIPAEEKRSVEHPYLGRRIDING